MNRLRESTRTKIGGGVALAGNKRKADISPKKVDAKKRSALGDVTNAAKKKTAILGLPGKDENAKGIKQHEKKDLKPDVKPSLIPIVTQDPPRVTRAKSKSLQGDEPIKHELLPKPLKPVAAPDPSRVLKELVQPKPFAKVTRRSRGDAEKAKGIAKKNDVVPLPSSSSSSSCGEEESLYQTAVSTPVIDLTEDSPVVSKEELDNKKNELLTKGVKEPPAGVPDFDRETGDDPFQVALYAADIFAYYKRRELRFPIRKYLDTQTELNKNMRSILVDWMVEVQESFEMNHETLYLAVKLVDLYLGKTVVKREKLQLVGTTALYIAAKYDERCPPVIDDFCYICDDAYSQKEVNQMECKILKTLKFDIGVPLSYRYLRRYARCAKLDMEVLTLARYILEMSLMEYDFIDTLDSMMAAAVLLLALKMIKVEDPWTPTLQYYSTYKVEDLFDLTHRVYEFMLKPLPHLKTIRSKYSHKIFYEVAKTPLPEELKL